MSDPLRHVQSGERFVPRAETHNAFVDAANAVRRGALGFEAQASESDRSTTVISVKNASGAPCGRFEALALVAPIILPSANAGEFASRAAAQGVLPDHAAGHRGAWCVLAEPLAAGAIGKAWVGGVFPCRVDVAEGRESFDRCDVRDGEPVLEMNAAGSGRVLWKESGTGTVWALVRLGDAAPLVRKAEMIDTLRQGDTEPAAAWLLEYVDEAWVRTAQQIELYGDQGFRGVAFGRTEEVDAGDKIDVYFSHEAQQWYGIVGAWYFHGNVVDDIDQGALGEVRLNVGAGMDAREIVVPAYSPYAAVQADDFVSASWNTFSIHWDIGKFVEAQEFTAGCGITITDGEIAVDPDLFGDGLSFADCELSVALGCGLEFDGSGNVKVKPADLAGAGLVPAASGCGIDVNPGHGIAVAGDAVKFDGAAVAGTNLTWDGTLLHAIDTGEANTGSNIGTAGVGPFDHKSGVDLRFRKLHGVEGVATGFNAGGSKVDVGLNIPGLPPDVAPAPDDLLATFDASELAHRAVTVEDARGFLGDHKDTVIAGPELGQVVKYVGAPTEWSNAFLNLDELGDTQITSPAAGHHIKHDGAKWVNYLPDKGGNFHGCCGWVWNATAETWCLKFGNCDPEEPPEIAGRIQGELLIICASCGKPKICVTAVTETIAEDGEPGAFSICRTGSTEEPLEVEFTLGGTAEEGVDYETVGTSVTIPIGESCVFVVIEPIDNEIADGDRTVALTVTESDDYTVNPECDDATITIEDDEEPPPPEVTVVAQVDTAIEGGEAGAFRISRTGSTAAALVVHFSLGGTADEGDDYEEIGTSVDIPIGESYVDVPVIAVADEEEEGPETVVLTIEPDAGYTIGDPDDATVTIEGEEPPEPEPAEVEIPIVHNEQLELVRWHLHLQVAEEADTSFAAPLVDEATDSSVAGWACRLASESSETRNAYPSNGVLTTWDAVVDGPDPTLAFGYFTVSGLDPGTYLVRARQRAADWQDWQALDDLIVS